MKVKDLKYIFGISIIFIFSFLHILLFNNDSKYDVYKYYDHERYLTNILYDISFLLMFSIFTYFLSNFKKRIFKPLFIYSLLQIPNYFLFYNQLESLVTLPILIILYIYSFGKR